MAISYPMDAIKLITPLLRTTSNRHQSKSWVLFSRNNSTTATTAKKIVTENSQIYAKLSEEWWSRNSNVKNLQRMNSLRVPMIRDGLLQTQETLQDSSSGLPLSGFNILDVGCGGGFLAEPLARLGAQVTGIDPVPENIGVAESHASLDPGLVNRLTYKACIAKELVKEMNSSFHAVIASEVLEHVDNVEDFVTDCVTLTRVGGSLFFTTINKTVASFLLAKVAAEYIFRVLPVGIHDWTMFVEPQILEKILTSNGCRVLFTSGMSFNPLLKKWSWSKVDAINYAVHAIKLGKA